MRAPARKRVGSIQPPVPQPRVYLVGARKQELPGATLLGTAVDVTWNRNGGEHAWSFVRISRVFDKSSTKHRCPSCIGCEQTADKRAGRPKNASTGTGLSDVDISCDQSSRWQKFAAVPEEISSARCREKPTVCRRLVTPIRQSCSRKRAAAAAAGMSALIGQLLFSCFNTRRLIFEYVDRASTYSECYRCRGELFGASCRI